MGLYSPQAVELPQKIHWVCPHVYPCSSTELAPIMHRHSLNLSPLHPR